MEQFSNSPFDSLNSSREEWNMIGAYSQVGDVSAKPKSIELILWSDAIAAPGRFSFTQKTASMSL